MFKFFSYSSLESVFLGKHDLDRNEFYISSVSDFLFIIEQFKKNKLQISADNLKERHEFITQKSNEGLINFIELDRDLLINNLFEENDDGVLMLDSKASNMNISPRFSISLLCLKSNELNCYWDHGLYTEMEMDYLENETYG